jgi:hypothetical protein
VVVFAFLTGSGAGLGAAAFRGLERTGSLGEDCDLGAGFAELSEAVLVLEDVKYCAAVVSVPLTSSGGLLIV